MAKTLGAIRGFFIHIFMLTFRQYLSEIFRQEGTYTVDQPSHPDLRKDSDEEVYYVHTPKNAKGEPIRNQEVRTSFFRTGENSWDVTFSVGGSTRTKGSSQFPSHITKKVFDHFKHFVDTTKQLAGKAPHIQYETTHPKKHRIYQAVAKRLGVTAENTGGWLDDDPDQL